MIGVPTVTDYGFQMLPAGKSSRYADGCVLIPLNVEWDTAALGRHVHFKSTTEWLISTIGAVLEQNAGPVVVRQHPSERRPLQRSKLDVAALLRESFGQDPRCQFVAADDPVSSYDLLRAARLVLPFVSTIGIEAAAMGKPVLIAGACYYTDLGFVWSAGSREEYFDLLQSWGRRRPHTSSRSSRTRVALLLPHGSEKSGLDGLHSPSRRLLDLVSTSFPLLAVRSGRGGHLRGH